MNRGSYRVVALAATTLPLALCAAFLLACCRGPWHDLAHEIVPMCHKAADWLSLGGGHDHSSSPPVERESRKEHAPSWDLEVRVPHESPVHFSTGLLNQNGAGARRRNFIAHGALRCDDDVGALLVLNSIFRI